MANYVKFKQGFSKDFNTTNQPLTNGMIYFVIDENNHGSIYYDTVLDGSKNDKNGTVRRIKFSGMPVEITGSVTGKGDISTDGSKIIINTTTNHSHGLAHQNFIVTLPNNTTEEWKQLGNDNSGFWLKSVRSQNSAPKWFLGNYSAGVAFGGADTKGVISVAYRVPTIRFAGGNGTKPVWSLTLTGTSDTTYDLNKIGSAYGWFGNKYLSADNQINWYATSGNTSSTRYGYIKNDIANNGNMHFVREQGGNFDFNGSLLPTATNTYDIGSASASWKNLHIQNISLYGQTANRLMWLNGSKAVQAANHFVNGAKIAVNYAGETNFNLYVNGSFKVTGEARIGKNRILNLSSTEASEPLLNALGFKGTGYPLYTDPEFASGTNNVVSYNNSNNDAVTVTRTQSTTSGNSSGYILAIKHTGAASPGHGGFCLSYTGRANAVFIQIFRAKVPTGYTLELASNLLGTNYSDQWLTDNSGTGKWEWYARRVVCGNTGTFSTGGRIYLATGTTPTASAPVTWYLSHINVYDVTKGNYDGLRTRYSDISTYLSDDTGTPTKNRFISTVKIVQSDGSVFSFRGYDGEGKEKNDLIIIPAASSSKAGLITNTTQTITGSKTFSNAATFNSTLSALGEVQVSNNLTFTNLSTGTRGITGKIGDNDLWRVVGGATATNQGYLEIATADDTNEPIYVRQYQGVFTTIKRTLTLLDANGNTHIPGVLYDKNAQELRAELFVASLKTKTSNINTYSFIGCNTAGIELSNSLVTIPLATTDKAGLISGEAQSLGGNKTWYGQHVIHKEGTSASLKSSTLRLSSVPKGSNDDSYTGGDVGLELWRGGNASWQIVNIGGNLIFKNNYTSTKESTYKVQSLKLNYNSGLASAPYISVNGENIGYRFYVNGTSYFNGNTTHNGYVDLTQTFALRRVGWGSSWNTSHQRAMIIMSTTAGWSPIISQKSSNGWWTQGHYTVSGYNDDWLFGFLPDANTASGGANALSTTFRMKNIGGDRMFVTSGNNSAAGSSATKPIYIDSNGKVGACTYELQSTVNSNVVSGSTYSNRMAYYNAANSITYASNIYTDGTALALGQSRNDYTFFVGGSTLLQGATIVNGNLHIVPDLDVGLNQSGSLVIGSKTGQNLAVDANEIMARNNSAASTLYLNNEGGLVQIGSGGLKMQGDIWSENIVPNKKNANILGNSSYRWAKLYIGSADTYGAINKPIYWNAGVPTPVDFTVGSNTKFVYAINGIFYASNLTAGSTTQPVFFRGGDVVACTYSLNATLNAGTANRMAYYSGANTISSANAIYVTSSGLGINLSSSSYAFAVKGNSYFEGDGRITGAFTAQGYYHGNMGIIINRTSAGAGGGYYLRNNGQTYARSWVGVIGTTDKNGTAYLQIGNELASGTAENARGVLRMYSSGAGYVGVCSGHILETNPTLYLPSVTGEVVTHKISTAVGSSSQPVYINSNGQAVACTSLTAGVEKSISYNISSCNGTSGWCCLGTLVTAGDSSSVRIDVYTGHGYNGTSNQNTHIKIFIKDGWQSSQSATSAIGITYLIFDSDDNATAIQVKGMASSHNTMTLYIYMPWGYYNGYYKISGKYSSWTNIDTYSTSAPSSGTAQSCNLGSMRASRVYGAAWNDYAECRQSEESEPGVCVVETGQGDLIKSSARLQPGANIISDTYGFAIGETSQTTIPLAVSGRVLAYPYEDKESFKAGDPVCSAPEGRVSKMTRQEVKDFPDRIIGTVSEIPTYETWGSEKVKVNGRIWIKVR